MLIVFWVSLFVFLQRSGRVRGQAAMNLCEARNSSSTRCCSVRDGVDRVDAPLMRYCADVSCVANPNVTRVANVTWVLQFSNAVIGQGVFEERAAQATFVLPKSRGSPPPRNLSEALIQCESSSLRKACLFVEPADFSVSADGVCSACLSVANWNIYADSKPVLSPERFVIACFKLYRAGWTPPVLITPMPLPLGPTPRFTIPPSAPDAGSSLADSPAPTTAASLDAEPNVGLIAGAAAGGAAALFILVVGGLLLCRKRGASASSSSSSSTGTTVANAHYDAPPIAMVPDVPRASGGGMDSARSSLGVGIPAVAAPMSRTNYSAFDEADDVRDKDPRTQGNDAQNRTAEQQRQIEDIRRRQQQHK